MAGFPPIPRSIYFLRSESIPAGEIIATALDSNDNQVHSVLLTPINAVWTGRQAIPSKDYAQGVNRPMILPEAVRKAMAGRFGITSEVKSNAEREKVESR